MKAITIKQPWASLIAFGEKHFETRSWQAHHRGQLAIHAGKKVDKKACEEPWIKDKLAEHGITSWQQLPTGVVLATAELVACHKIGLGVGAVVATTGPVIQGFEYYFGDYTAGRWAWELANVQVLPEPVAAKGQLSLWEWNKPEEVEDKPIRFKARTHIYWEDWGQMTRVFVAGRTYEGVLHANGKVMAETPYYEGISDYVDRDEIEIIDS